MSIQISQVQFRTAFLSNPRQYGTLQRETMGWVRIQAWHQDARVLGWSGYEGQSISLELCICRLFPAKERGQRKGRVEA